MYAHAAVINTVAMQMLYTYNANPTKNKLFNKVFMLVMTAIVPIQK